ncbi:MAG: leucine-rich repeat protein [Alistipes sp.]|nr:leucine-rich repeat protein [Alistipes sp.]
MKKLFLLLAAVGVIFTACEGSDGVEEENGGTPSTPKIELSQQSIEVDFESAQHSISITSPYSWEATAKNDWIEVIAENGIAGTKELKFSVERNEELEIREGTIVVKNDDYNLIAELYITQKAFVPAITIEPETLTFAVEGGTQEVAITVNFEYEASTNADWLTIEKSENGVSVTVPNYVEVDERTAEITISSEKYGVSKVISVTQGAFVPEWTIEPESLTFAVEGGTQEVAVTANFDEYEFSTNVDWLTIEKSDKGISVTVPNYVEVEERTAEITISNEKYGVSKVINVTQGAFVTAITIEPETLTFASEGSMQQVTVIANFEYEYSTNADWLTIKKSEKGVNITATTNTKFEERTAETTISSNKYNISKVIKVTQNGLSEEVYEKLRIIYYTSSDGNIVTPYESDVFGANIVSNTYKDGQGIIIFDAPITSIGDLAFFNCSSLTSVTIPDSVTSIGRFAFDDCTSLKSVTIGNNVTSIESDAFLDCTSLTAFYGKFASSDNRCLIINGVLNFFAPAGLSEYTIPNSVTSIGWGAFEYCRSLKSVTIPDSVTSIGYYAFHDCTSLKSVTIGNSVTSIGIYAFYGCTSLTSVTIGNSITSIGYSAFYECTSLTSVTIPNSVTEIGSYAFAYCSSLKYVYCKPTTPPTGDYTMFYKNASWRKIYVPTSSVDAYKTADGWSDYANYIVGYDF